MTLGFEERLEYSTATCRSREEMLDDFTATCRSLEERMKLSTRWGKDCREQMKFETIKTPAMDPGNEGVISDFLTFVNGKKFYRRKGKTWKRGYLLYEPPGSDGASLIAAMADFLEFNLYNLDLASFSSFSELKNTLLVGTWSSSVIAIHDLDDFDHCAGMLPNLKNELTGTCLLEFVNGLLSSCGDEQIIVFNTNNRDRHDAARRRHFNEDIYVHKSSTQPIALADEGETVQLNSSRQKPLVDFEATNIKAYQSNLLVSNSEEKNTRKASARRCTTESVCSFVDSMTSISSTDFDALDNRAHLGRAYHSGPIMFNSKKKDMREASARRCTTESVCSFVDSMTSISSTDFDALDNRAHLGRAYHSGPIVFNSKKKGTREGLSGECLTKSALSFDDSTKRKSLPFDVNLSSFSEHASQDFDDFDFVGFDYGAGMLPNLKDEASTRRCMTESVCSLVDSMPSISSTDFDALDNRSHLGRAYQSGPIVFNSEMGSTKSRLVRCPKCRQVLRELANVPVYMCGGCNTVLQAKKRKNDTKDKDLQKPDTNMGKKTELEQDSEDKEARSLSKEEMLSSSGELPLDKNNGSYDKENENSNMNQSGLAHHGNEESSPEAGVDQDKCSLKHNIGGDPNEYAQSNGKYIGGVNLLSTKLRLVRCPKCHKVLPEPANVPVYQCGECNTVLKAKKHKNDQDKCSLKHNNGGDPNEYAQSNGKYIGGVNLLDEVASPTEPNHHKSAESEVDKSGICLEEENGVVNFSDEVASSTELNHLGSEESSPVAGAHSEVDENKNCLEQEVVSSTEFNNNEIEVSSPVVRAYSEANEHGICNGKQTGGVNISDEVVSSTELNDNEIKVSSPVVVTAHSEANEHKTCMEQNNGMNRREFGDFKLDCSKNTKSSGEISSSTELSCQEIEESTPVIETNAQLKKLSTRRLTLEFEERLDDFMATIRRRDCREPMTLETIKMPVMDPGNEDVISDFMTFVNGKKFYKRKGKTWKRGYLLYEPPGSDGASLIAAMADFLEFKLYNLDLASFSSFSELKNTLLVGTWSSSVIAIRDLVDFEHCAGMLPNLKNELTDSCLLEFVNGLLSSCGDEQIIVFTTNNRDRHDAARRPRFNEDIYIHKSSPQPVALADEGEIVQLDSSRQKPLVDFEATNIKAYQSSLLVSNSEEKNTREASTKRCMTESVCSFVDSMTSISAMDFDALDNRAHLGRAYQSGPIVFNSEKKDTREGLSGECLTKSALSFDDSAKRKSLPFDVNLSSSEHSSQDFDDFDFVGFDCGSGMLPNLKDEIDSSEHKPLVDFDATSNRTYKSRVLVSNSEKKNTRGASKRQCMTKSVPSFDALDNRAHLVEAHQSTSSMELKQPENEGIISDLLGFLRDKEFYKRIGKAWKRGYLLYDSPCTDRSSLIAAMANCLEFDIYDLNLTGVSSISELTNVLVPIRNRSVIAIKDFDRWFAMLPSLKNELTISGLLKIIHGFLSSCGDEQIIVLTTNHNHIDRVDAALLRPLRFDLYIHKSSPQPKALPDGGEIVLLDSSEQKPSADFDATNNRACQSDILVSSSEEKNMREASRRQCMPEGVLSLVDSGATRISSTDFDAPDNSAHLVRAYKNGPIVFNSEKEDMGEELNRECFTKSILTFDDSSVQKSLSDVDVTENKSHLVRAYLSGSFMSLSDNKNRGEALKRKCITKSILGLEDLQPISRDRRDDAAKSFCGIHTTYSLAPISFEVFETLPTREKPNKRRLTLEDCVQQEKSPDLPRVTQINEVEQRVTKMPRYLGGLTPQSASSSRWPIGLPDGGHIDLVDPFVQFTTNIEHAARADQCSPTESCAEKKMVRKTLKRMCRTMSVIFEENHQHFARRCKGTAKSLGAMRIFRKHGINQVSPVKRIHKQHGVRQWPFRQKWATRKGYSLGDERPFEVSSLYMDEKLDSRLQFIHMSKFARSSPWALTLPDGGEIVGPVALSLSEFAATNNRAHLVEQDQSGSTASYYECKNTRETSDKQGLEDLKRHFGCKDKDAVKSLGVSVSMFKSTCRQHWVYCWPGQFENNEQQAFDATNNRAHLVKADESGSTVSNSERGSTREGLKRDCLTNALSLEDLRQHFGARHKDAAEGLCDSPAWMSFEVLDSLPLGERSNIIRYLARRRTLTHKHCVRLKKSQDLLRSLQRDCSGGLAPQSDIGLLDGGHILSLSEKKIVRKTLKRKCRTMSVLSLEDHQHHVGWRWEDAVKFLGTKRICRQLAIHCETTAKRIHRQLGTRRWPFKQTAIGLSDGGHILSLSEKKILRKTLKRKCRSMSLLSLEDHKQHVDGRWEDAAKSHGTKRICRQLVIHRLSTAKRICKQHGIHWWPFQRSAIGLPDGHILPLSEKKIVRTTLKRKCRSMSVLSLVDHQQHVDRRWEDAAMNIGAKPICRQLVIHCVSIAKRIYRQHGIYHRWPFQQDWTKMKGYSLGDERPIEVISLSTHVKLVPRLQLIYISWLGRFSPRPSALAGGGEIGGPIALSLSESAATKNIAQHVGQDQSGYAASDSENERTREQGDPEEINATITLHDIRRHYGRRNREDAAASLAISVSTFKRKCREYGIKRWPHVRKRKVGRPPDQYGEGNTSTARETPLHYVQTGMEGELVGQNEVANVFQRDFMGGPIALNTESGLIMVSRPPDQHGERNTSTACGKPSRNVETGMEVEPVGQNHEANVFRRDFMYGPIALNTDGITFPECSDAVAPSQPMATTLDRIPHLNGDSSECAFQVKNQSTLFTANPYANGLVDPHPQIALTETLSENMERLEDRRNLLAPRKEPLPEGHVFGSVNWTVCSCSDVALSQPMPTIPHTMGCSEYWRNSLALLEEHLLEENDYGSINLTAPSCFDPGPSQPMHTIPHTMPTIPQIMPLLTERQDMRSLRLKATYGNTTIKFPLPSGFSELKEEVSKRLEFEHGSFKLEYKDEEGDSVLIACDEDVRDYLRLLTSLGNQVVKLFVLDKVPNTTNFCDNCGCDNCRSLKCKRP